MSNPLIGHLEELAANAWSAAVVQIVDGWRLRYAGGVIRRANSVWPNQMGHRHTLVENLARVEDFYTYRGLPPRFQMTPAAQPANLDNLLAQRGYTGVAQTCVQVGALTTLLAQTETAPVYPVTISDTFEATWFEVYCQAEAVNPAAAAARQDILQRIGPRRAFALAQIDHQPAGVALGVVERGWIGLFSLVTLPEFRRRGVALALLRALGQWGQRHQAGQLYLQVTADNAPAQALYAPLGFETLYHYHYRERQI